MTVALLFAAIGNFTPADQITDLKPGIVFMQGQDECQGVFIASERHLITGQELVMETPAVLSQVNIYPMPVFDEALLWQDDNEMLYPAEHNQNWHIAKAPDIRARAGINKKLTG